MRNDEPCIEPFDIENKRTNVLTNLSSQPTYFRKMQQKFELINLKTKDIMENK